MADLNIKIREEGAEATAKKLEELENQIKKLEEQSKKSNNASDDQKKKFDELQKKTIGATDSFQKVTSVAGQMGEGIGKVAGQLGQMKTAFEGATGIIAGPWGLALGGALAGLAAFNLIVEEANELQEKLKRSFVDSVNAIKSLESSIKDQEEALKEYKRILDGTSTAEERRIRLLANQQRQIQISEESNDKFATTLRNVWNWLDRNSNAVGTLRTRLEIKNLAQRESNRIGEESIRIMQRENDELMRNLELQAQRNDATLTARGLASRGGVPGTMAAIDPEQIRQANARRFQEEQQERERRSAEARRRRQEQEREELRQFQELTRQLVDFEQMADFERRMAIEEQNMLLEEQLALAGKIAEQKAMAAEEERMQLEQANTEKILLEQKRIESQMALEARQANQRAKQEQIVGNAISNIQGLTMRSIDLAKQEGITRKEAFKSALDQWLKGFAIEQAFKGAENTINAIASYARYDYAAGSQFLAAAAGNFALAAAAGGASAAIPNSGIAGSGAPEQRREETPTDSESRNITINVQGVATTEAGVGRALRQALETEQRRR